MVHAVPRLTSRGARQLQQIQRPVGQEFGALFYLLFYLLIRRFMEGFSRLRQFSKLSFGSKQEVISEGLKLRGGRVAVSRRSGTDGKTGCVVARQQTAFTASLASYSHPVMMSGPTQRNLQRSLMKDQPRTFRARFL